MSMRRGATDRQFAPMGAMAPTGGDKGVGAALLVEIGAAAMAGATLGLNASPFSGTKGGLPKKRIISGRVSKRSRRGGAKWFILFGFILVAGARCRRVVPLARAAGVREPLTTAVITRNDAGPDLCVEGPPQPRPLALPVSE